MHRWRRLLAIGSVPVAGLILVTSAIAARPPDNQKVSVCHVTGQGTFREISVSERALPALEAHGDVVANEFGYCPS